MSLNVDIFLFYLTEIIKVYIIVANNNITQLFCIKFYFHSFETYNFVVTLLCAFCMRISLYLNSGSLLIHF